MTALIFQCTSLYHTDYHATKFCLINVIQPLAWVELIQFQIRYTQAVQLSRLPNYGILRGVPQNHHSRRHTASQTQRQDFLPCVHISGQWAVSSTHCRPPL